MTAQVITNPTHHSLVTAEQSRQMSEQRRDWVACGRPDDHPYARAIALIEYDGPAAMIRGTVYVLSA